MYEQNDFKPYIPADKVTPEFTITSIVMGIILAVVFCQRVSGPPGRNDDFCLHSGSRDLNGSDPGYYA